METGAESSAPAQEDGPTTTVGFPIAPVYAGASHGVGRLSRRRKQQFMDTVVTHRNTGRGAC